MTNKLIIIGGLPRSGSTLLRFLLDSSETVLAGPETNFFRFPLWQTLDRLEKISARLSNKLDLDQSRVKRAFLKSSSSVEAFIQLMHLYAALNGSKKTVYAEKSPYNCHSYHRLANEVDDVYFISTVRNGLDVVTSKIEDHPKRSGYWCSVQRYIDDCNAIFSFSHKRHMIWEYEASVTQPIEQAERLFEFIQEPFSDKYFLEMMQPSKTRDPSKVNQPKLKQVISDQWVNRWQAPEHKEKVREFCANERALYWLERSGYEVNNYV